MPPASISRKSSKPSAKNPISNMVMSKEEKSARQKLNAPILLQWQECEIRKWTGDLMYANLTPTQENTIRGWSRKNFEVAEKELAREKAAERDMLRDMKAAGFIASKKSAGKRMENAPSVVKHSMATLAGGIHKEVSADSARIIAVLAAEAVDRKKRLPGHIRTLLKTKLTTPEMDLYHVLKKEIRRERKREIKKEKRAAGKKK